MERERILVTNAADDGGVVTMRALSNAGFEVISTDSRRLLFDIRSKYSQSHYLLSGSNQESFEGHLLRLVHRLAPDAILPLGHRATLAACRHLDTLAAMTALNVPHFDSFMAANNKSVCLAECRNLGIPCPDTYSENDAVQLLDENNKDLTLVVKPSVNSGGAAGVSYVRRTEELLRKLNSCIDRFGEATIQEYIPGGSAAMKTVVLLFSSDSRLDCAFTTQKLRQWPTTGGQMAAGLSTADHHLVQLVLPFFEKWQWRGAAEVELKFDHRDGRHKVIEINPRFPVYLRFAVHCGLNLPQRAVHLALNSRPISSVDFPAYAQGAKYVNPALFLRALFSEFSSRQSSFGTFRTAMSDIRGSASVLLSMLDDPLPLISRNLVKPRDPLLPTRN